MTSEELFEKYKNHPQDGDRDGRGFHSWEETIFERIRQKIQDDEEALALFEHTLDYAESKSLIADLY